MFFPTQKVLYICKIKKIKKKERKKEKAIYSLQFYKIECIEFIF